MDIFKGIQVRCVIHDIYQEHCKFISPLNLLCHERHEIPQVQTFFSKILDSKNMFLSWKILPLSEHGKSRVDLRCKTNSFCVCVVAVSMYIYMYICNNSMLSMEGTIYKGGGEGKYWENHVRHQ